MPPPGSDSGSDDPASESSDTANSEPKTYLVMSGGEGYIDFRMGKNAGVHAGCRNTACLHCGQTDCPPPQGTTAAS